MEIKNVKISELKEHPRNPRVHPDSALNKLVKSIKEYGWTNPVLVSKDGYILAGHARCKAAQKAGINEVPVIFLDLEGEKADAYLIADNKIQEETEWDIPKLAELMEDLMKGGTFDVSLTGFDVAEIEDLFSKVHDKEVKEDDFNVDEALKEPTISKQGDVWLLGRHRLICGDSTEAKIYAVLMEGKKANLVVTDPPYGVAYDGSQGTIKNDNLKDDEFYKFLLNAFTNMSNCMADDASIYVFHADTKGLIFRRAYEDAGFYLSGVCQWVKQSLVLGRSPYQWKNEPCLFGWKKKGKHNWYAGRKETTVWEFDKPSKSKLHSTMKPIALIAYPIKNSSITNCIVLEPFSGSGTTIIACEQTERICYAIELDERFVDVAVKRYIEQVGSDEEVFLLRGGVKRPLKDVQKSE